MAEFLALQVRMWRITIAQVPERWREAVAGLLGGDSARARSAGSVLCG